jgi:hypothetical protein
MPDNARYIPDDAVAVAGINLKTLGKKIAWNLITGSKLYKEMQQRMSAEGAEGAMKGIENAGIDVVNTFYIYTRSDTRFAGGNLVVALVPLTDAARWEAYVKQVFPDAAIQQRDGRKEAWLGAGMYAGWDAQMLILVNGSVADDDVDEISGSEVLMEAEMARAFRVPTSNTMVNNPRFASFAGHGYDLSFWLNYGSLLTSMSGDASADLNGVSLSSASWHGAVVTAGVDFRKGKIAGEVAYYLPAQVEEATKDFGLVKTDKELLNRLPKNEKDMLVAMHISPEGVKTLLEKAGLFGPANIGLTTQGLDMDYVLSAFTGDMAIAMNNFSLQAQPRKDSFMGQLVEHSKLKTTMSMTYAVKVNNREHFARLLEMTAVAQMQLTDDGYVLPLTTNDSLHLHMRNGYAVMSNVHDYATGIPDGSYMSTKMPSDAADKAYNSPFCIYLDVRQMLAKIDPAISSEPRDSAIIAESKKLLDNVAIYGGNYTDNAYKFNLEINFTNKDENSILELLDFGMRMNEIKQTQE